MICPKCESVVADDIKTCSSCGYKFSDEANKKNASKKSPSKARRTDRLKRLIILTAALVLVITAVVLVVKLSSNKGMRKTEKLAKKIGQSTGKASEYANIDLTSVSDYEFLNELTDYSYIYESEKKVKVYGVNVPSWSIFCNEDMFGNLSDVMFYDFKILEDNINGEKQKNKPDLTSVVLGMTEEDVDKLLDMKPYIVSFSDGVKSKKYKYYYKDKQSGDVAAYFLTILFDDDGNVSAPPIEEENKFITGILKSGNT